MNGERGPRMSVMPAKERVKKSPASIAVMAGLDPRLSGFFLWTRSMTLILLPSWRFATVWTRKGINAMRHKNSVYHGILQYVPWAGFEELVEEHEGDKT